MRSCKKFAALLLVLAMVFSLALTAFAAEQDYTITIQNDADHHTYAAYQIFAGDVSDEQLDGAADPGPILSNIQWGTGVDGAALLAALAADQAVEGLAFAADMSAADVAKVLQGASTAQLNAFAAVAVEHLTQTRYTSTQGADSYTISVPAGYYLLMDVGEDATADGTTNYMVQVLGNVTMTPKSDAITSYKKVADWNDSEEYAMANEERWEWQDSADHDIGDHVSFQLVAILPANLLDYATYELVFHDQQSAGFTFDDNVEVQLSTDGGAHYTPLDHSQYTVATDTADGCTFEVAFADVTQIPGVAGGAHLKVVYTATLNQNADHGRPGNPNTMHVSYHNGQGAGRTPDDTVVVFTYKTVIDKVDGEGSALTGAAFRLEKYDARQQDWVTAGEFTVDEENPVSSFAFPGLDDGDYRLVETVTPSGYNSIDPIAFTVTATHDILSDDPTLTALSGNAETGAMELRFTVDETDGALCATVVNQSGATLPETGGIGTTVFYALGGALVVIAGVLLVVRRRMRAEDRRS